MDIQILTIGTLGLLVAGGWLIDFLRTREDSRFNRRLARQLRESADTILGPRP
jgi:hypothetical protein